MEQQSRGQDLGDQAALLDRNPGLHLGRATDTYLPEDWQTSAATAAANETRQLVRQTDDTEELTLGQTFANEILRRMEAEDGVVLDEDGLPKDTTALGESLGETLDWLRERFGDDTASAAAGMILKATASGVNEETLGEGLLDTLQFIDRNFGISAGDEAIAQFNANINQALNSYFDNGVDELFFDAGATTAQDLSSQLFAQTDQTTASALDGLDSILQDLKGELNNIVQLQDLTSHLESQFSPISHSMQEAMSAYTMEFPVDFMDNLSKFTDLTV